MGGGGCALVLLADAFSLHAPGAARPAGCRIARVLLCHNAQVATTPGHIHMNANGKPLHRTGAALLLCSFGCSPSVFAASFEDAMRILNQLKSAIPATPTAP